MRKEANRALDVMFEFSNSTSDDVATTNIDELPKSKEDQEVLQVMRKHQEGQSYFLLDLSCKSPKFVTLVS